MPLIFHKNPEADCQVMVWEIEETQDYFKEKLGKKNFEIAEFEIISHPHKRLEWLASRFLAKFLAENMHLNFHGLIKDDNSKPYLHKSDHHLSISHTVSHVAAAIHLHKPVGIDLEDITPRLHIIKHKFLTDSERENANDELAKLCVLWSAKESLYKLYGKRGILFKEQLLVKSFDISDGILKGEINMNDYSQNATIYKYEIGKAYLTVAI
jgi:4'-phosphopantetheinyl transferase